MRRSGLDGCSACRSDVGHADSRIFTETTLADEALLEVEGRRNELTVEWPGMRMSSLTRVVQVRIKSGREIVESILRERGLRLISNWKPPSFVWPR